MSEQEKKQQEETTGTTETTEKAEHPEQEEQAQPQEDQIEKLKETTEKIWDSTVHAFSTATFRANQYKKLVQKKIDLSALHKKIGATHSELGKLIDDLREAGKKSIMSQAAVKDMLARLDELKAEAASLEEEIEQLRTEGPPQEKPVAEEKTE
jgi:hypothetical protein